MSRPLPVCTFMVLCAPIFTFGKVYLWFETSFRIQPLSEIAVELVFLICTHSALRLALERLSEPGLSNQTW